MPTTTVIPVRQSGVIPYRVARGLVDVLLVTNRDGGRWIVPKGHVEPSLTPQHSAMKEALEEAGIVGRIDPDPVGTYVAGRHRLVELFPLRVVRMHVVWDEMHHRRRRWVPLARASVEVAVPGLSRCIDALAQRLARPVSRERAGIDRAGRSTRVAATLGAELRPMAW